MKNYFLIAALAALVFSMGSCKSDKKDEPNYFEGIYYDERSSDREYIETVASKTLEFIKPYEQQDALTGLHAFVDLCDTYEFPDNFYDSSLRAPARGLADAIEDNDYYSLSRAVGTFVYNFARFKGQYQATPGSYAWVKMEDRDDLRFKYFVGPNNIEYNITVSGSGSASTISVKDGGSTYQIEIPKVIDMTLSRGNIASPVTLITAKVQTEVRDNESLNLSTNIKVGSIYLESTTKGTNTKITEDMTLCHDNPMSYERTVLLSTSSAINGSNMCSVSAWQRAAETDNIQSVVSSCSSTTMIYRSIQIKTNVSNVKTFADNAGWWSSDEYSDPRGMAQKAASALTGVVTAEVRYNGDDKDKLRGTLGWQPYQCDDWDGYEEWEVRPTITFAKDNVTHGVSAYFGNGHFLSVENSINSLLKTYKTFWR